jgi:Kef-type K+ transport system membrane component KefB
VLGQAGSATPRLRGSDAREAGGPAGGEPTIPPVPPTVLSVVFLVVMAVALGCFWAAFRYRKTLRTHKRLGIAGVVVDLAGTVAVVVATRGLGWHVPAHDANVATAHRALAYVATALVLLVGATGAARHPIHVRLWPVFLPVYTATYVLAFWAYAPR